MILFDKGFMLNDWRTVYVGLKKHWLTPEEVLSYCEYGYILCSEEMFTEMYMLSELSDENLLNLTRKIYPDPIWKKIDDDLYERQIEVSKNYYLFWAVEKLLEIVALGKDKTSKPIDGNAGVYVVVNKGVAVNKQDAGDIKQLQQQLMQQNSNVFPQAFMRSLQNNADIKDYRIQVYDLAGH